MGKWVSPGCPMPRNPLPAQPLSLLGSAGLFAPGASPSTQPLLPASVVQPQPPVSMAGGHLPSVPEPAGTS